MTTDQEILKQAGGASIPPGPGFTSIALHVVGAKPGASVEAIPGKTVLALAPESVETLALTEFVPAGNGTYRPIVRVCPRKFTLTPLNLKRLCIAISVRGLLRLIRAGFVQGELVTPGVTQFDYFDYRRHEAAVAADPEFWERVDPNQPNGLKFTNRQRYRQAL